MYTYILLYIYNIYIYIYTHVLACISGGGTSVYRPYPGMLRAAIYTFIHYVTVLTPAECQILNSFAS